MHRLRERQCYTFCVGEKKGWGEEERDGKPLGDDKFER